MQVGGWVKSDGPSGISKQRLSEAAQRHVLVAVLETKFGYRGTSRYQSGFGIVVGSLWWRKHHGDPKYQMKCFGRVLLRLTRRAGDGCAASTLARA